MPTGSLVVLFVVFINEVCLCFALEFQDFCMKCPEVLLKKFCELPAWTLPRPFPWLATFLYCISFEAVKKFYFNDKLENHYIGRLYDQFLEPFFVLRYEEEEGPELRSHLGKLQKQAAAKQEKRVKLMGELLRSKGFVWVATSNFIMGAWQQAGNILR